MAFRFRRTVTLFPGFRLNLSKSGASVSVGPKGLKYTVGSKGTRVTAGIPGTGLSLTQHTPHARQAPSPSSTTNGGANFQPQQFTTLNAIESAPANQFNELSTSELAPILNSAQRRSRFAPSVLCICVLLFVFALLSKDQLLIGLAALHTAIFLPVAISLDRYRRSVKINYQLDDTFKNIAAAIDESFADLKACAYVWNISARGDTSDWKRNAGASKITKRQRVYPQSKRPGCIRGDVSFPSCTVGAEELYFLPDAMLVVASNSVAALHYKDFSTSLSQVRFIEEETVPRDTSVIGQTWRYVNKSGGPDRRFGSNRQIPVCLYGQISFNSPGGLNEILQFSNPSAGDRFAKVSEILHGFDAPISQSKSVKSFSRASRWSSVMFWTFFLIAALPIGFLTLMTIQSARDQSTASNAAVPATITNTAPPPIQRSTSTGNNRNAQSVPSPTRPSIQRLEAVPFPRPRPMP